MNTKFADLRKTKINDLFCLIQKYTCDEQDKLDKYFVIQTILKGLKENNIKNKLVELYNNKRKLIVYVVHKSLLSCKPMCLTSVSQHIEDIFCYREIDGVDCLDSLDCLDIANIPNIQNHQSNLCHQPMDVDMSVIQNGIDTLDALQSIFRRLIV